MCMCPHSPSQSILRASASAFLLGPRAVRGVEADARPSPWGGNFLAGSAKEAKLPPLPGRDSKN